MRCQVRGSIEPLLRVLATSGVRQLISREPSLEELFLEHYARPKAPDEPTAPDGPTAPGEGEEVAKVG